ncbi:MAG: hypothetical protein IT477_11345 [Rhodanobacteraceae bacterium]|nr:hypothetical protein [Rhodanobacteraceae bacterium]
MNVKELARDIALYDPRFSLGLLESARRPKNYSMQGDFKTGALGDEIPLTLKNKGLCDICVYGIEYTIEAPNRLKGNTFKSSEDEALVEVPFMDIRLEIDSCPNELLTDDYEAIQLALNPSTQKVNADACCGPIFCLFCDDTLNARIKLTRAYEEAELPIRVKITVHTFLMGGVRFLNERKVSVAAGLLEERYQIPVDLRGVGVVRPIPSMEHGEDPYAIDASKQDMRKPLAKGE